jgi:hypothetical protein
MAATGARRNREKRAADGDPMTGRTSTGTRARAQRI